MTPEYYKFLYVHATVQAIFEQAKSGIDIVSDGELNRHQYYTRQLANIVGLESSENGWIEVGPIDIGAPFLADDWTTAQMLTSQPVKISLTGPLTLAMSVERTKSDLSTLARQFVAPVRAEIHQAIEKGCRNLQLDEPGFTINPEAALDFGFDLLDQCLHGISDAVMTYLHLCRGYPKLKDVSFAASGKMGRLDCYELLVDELNASRVDVVSLEHAVQPLDPDLVGRLKDKTIMLGVVSIGSDRVETVEEIITSATPVLDQIPPERLILAPDCGAKYLSRVSYMKKLKNLVLAASHLNQRWT